MQEGGPWRRVINTHPHRTRPPMGSGHQQLPAPSVGQRSGCPHGWPNLGDRRAWTTHNPKDAQRSSAEADRAAALDLDLWLPRTSDVEQLTFQVRTRWILMDIHRIMNSSRTIAHVIFDHREGQHSPSPTMDTPASGGM